MFNVSHKTIYFKMSLKFLMSLKAIESHEYHMKIVPTIYEDLSGNNANSFQYTYAYKSHISFSHHGIVMPAIWFK